MTAHGSRRIIGLTLVALVALLLSAPSARGQEERAEEQTPTLKELQRQLSEQQRQLSAQQRQLSGQRRQLDALERVGGDAEDQGIVEAITWKEYSILGHRIKFYGFLRADVIYDDSRANNTQVIGFIRSEDRGAPPSVGAKKDSESFVIHPRLSRFGFDFEGPTIDMLGDAKTTAKLEVDFYGPGFSESRQALRLRKAYVKLAWDSVSLLAGQTGDLISPLFPVINPDMAMWGAGNLGDRRPQVRVEFTPELGPGSLYLGGMIGLTGADDNADFDAPGTFGAGYADGQTSGLPTLQARAAWTMKIFEGQKLEIGLYSHGGWEDPDTRIVGEGIFKSWAIGFDARIPLFEDLLWLSGEGWLGENVDDVRGGIFQGINIVLGKEIEARGGWIELGVRPGTDWFYFALGFATDDPDNSDLNAGGRANNQIWYVATRFRFGPIGIGLDYQRWKTEYKGFHAGRNNRIQAYLSFSW